MFWLNWNCVSFRIVEVSPLLEFIVFDYVFLSLFSFKFGFMFLLYSVFFQKCAPTQHSNMIKNSKGIKLVSNCKDAVKLIPLPCPHSTSDCLVNSNPPYKKSVNPNKGQHSGAFFTGLSHLNLTVDLAICYYDRHELNLSESQLASKVLKDTCSLAAKGKPHPLDSKIGSKPVVTISKSSGVDIFGGLCSDLETPSVYFYEKCHLNQVEAHAIESTLKIESSIFPIKNMVNYRTATTPIKTADHDSTASNISGKIALARQNIQNILETKGSCDSNDVLNRISSLEKSVEATMNMFMKMSKLIEGYEKTISGLKSKTEVLESKIGLSAKPKDDDGDIDFFGSDDEEDDETKKKITEQRLAAYAAKKAKKPAVIAKSNIILDVKPWEDTTDMQMMEKLVREIKEDGLLWGASKLVPLAYGIKKLQISCVVEDDKISLDWLQEQIEAIEDLVQSVDVAAFNKI